MKALSLLEELRDVCLDMPLRDGIIEAIEELEELENRSCGNCKQFAKYENQDFGACFGMARTLSDIDTVSKDFCCNKWEK